MKIKLKKGTNFEFIDIKKVARGTFKVDYIKKLKDNGVVLMSMDRENTKIYKLYLREVEWEALKKEMKENTGRMAIEKGHDIDIVFYGEKGRYEYNKEKERFEFKPEENEIIEF